MLFTALVLATFVDRNADEAALSEIKTTDWPNFYRQQDVEGLDAYLDENFVLITPDGSHSLKQDELRGVAAEPWNPTNFEYTIIRFDWFSEDLVQVTGRGTSLRADENGEPCQHSYVSTNLVQRAQHTDLGWQALASHVSGLTCDPLDAE